MHGCNDVSALGYAAVVPIPWYVSTLFIAGKTNVRLLFQVLSSQERGCRFNGVKDSCDV